MADYSTWTMDELQARFMESAAQYTALANERQAIAAEMDMRKANAALTAKLSAMTDAEKAALRQALG